MKAVLAIAILLVAASYAQAQSDSAPCNLPHAVGVSTQHLMSGSRARTYFKDLDASGILRKKAVPEWLALDPATMSASILRLPERGELDLSINEQLIVEFYSR